MLEHYPYHVYAPCGELDSDRFDAIDAWLVEHVADNAWGYKEYYGNDTYVFINPDDAFRFKLRWGG